MPPFLKVGLNLFKKRIRERINTRFLKLITNDVYNIAKRVREYDDSLFIVFNTKSQKYELHSLDNKGNTFCMTIPYNQLDARIETLIRKGDIRNRGMEIWREMEHHNEQLERQLRESHKRERRALIADTRSLFAKSAW